MPKPGDRIELEFTNDEWTNLKPGDQGVVTHIREAGDITQYSVRWDNGSSLMMVPGTGDRFKVVESAQTED